ncbi:MAG: MotA/TolQ/ExbB proton channel family protein [Phycisphaerae bacterium]
MRLKPLIPVLLAAATVAACAGPARGAAADAAGDDLLARAKGARAEAETALAEAREDHLEARRTLAADLAEAYDALDAARTKAEAARTAREALARQAADLERTAPLAADQARRHVRHAADAVGAEVAPGGPIAAVEQAIRDRLDARLGGVRRGGEVRVASEAVIARDGREADVPVLRVGDVAAYACGRDRETLGLLRTGRNGRPLVAGPYLPPEGAEALRSAAAGTLVRLPLDVTGSLADRAATEPKTLRAWLEAGGLFIYPIVAVGALGIILVLERFGYLVLTKPRPSLLSDVLAHLQRGNADAAREVAARSRIPAGRVLAAGVEAVGKSEDQREAAMESALLAEVPHLERSLSLLGALAGVAPLLGLLGTVSGMIATFDTISSVGTGNPRLLSGGISEALITTQLGLMVAIPLLLAHAGLERWVQRREAMLEHQAIQVFGVQRSEEDEGEEADAP